MATAKQQPKKTLYHEFFCSNNIGEADGFFEIVDGKLKLVDCWSTNDAHWRGEYMTGLLRWAGVDLKDLPEKYQVEAEKLLCKCWGIDYEPEEDEEEKLSTDQTIEMFYQEGNSDKVYILEISESARDLYKVVGHYGRRGGKIKDDLKCTGLDYEDAKKVFDQVLKEKRKKGYQYQNPCFHECDPPCGGKNDGFDEEEE
jgi:predicted DNA-binding WGR domain protein